jgi:DNA polymerase-1
MAGTALIDGDVLAYQAASANEYNTQWDPHQWTRHADMGAATKQLDDSINTLTKKADCDEIIIALSAFGGDYFRRKINPDEYKSNRNQPKPVIYQALRDYMAEVYTTFERPNLEGDDILGIIATHKTLVPGRKVVISIDKDMRSIPCHLLDPKKLDQGVVEILEGEANAFFYTQILKGDPIDGYKGCPGIGQVKAKKILEPFVREDPKHEFFLFDIKMAWLAVLEAFKKKGLGREVALMNARMARILRAEDYDVRTRQIKLWEPPA